MTDRVVRLGAGMAIDAWILLGVLTWAPRDPAGVVMLATSLGLVAASAMVFAVPVLAFGWLVRTHLVAGMTFGAVRR